MNPTILLTIDVEDWFQVENFKQWIPFSSWSSCEFRVEKNTHRLLDLLESCNKLRTTDQKRGGKPRATFFVLAWLAKRLPHLVREIHARGHEVASHGYLHKLCNEQSTEELRQDLSGSKKLLEDIIGFPVIGYRAPSFSINEDILKIIEECGYLYDSSFNSFGMHGRYGRLDLSRNRNNGISVEISNKFYELPVSNFKIGNRIFPLGGGGYFRMLPFPFFKMGVKNILKKEKAYLFYMHPWEIDPAQPKVRQASAFFKFRHYVNLNKTHSKLSKFMENFDQCRFITCRQYLQEAGRLGGWVAEGEAATQ
jgi:polysaccharide deacetylase family protein (PEP-CTERM system associated)